MMLNLKKNMGKYLIGTLLGVLASALLYFVQPVQWRGQALVKIGQISKNEYIEPFATVIERLKSQSFIQDVAERAKKNEISALLNVEEGDSMTIKQRRDSDVLKITVVDRSAELAQASIEAVVAEIVSKHDAIINVYQADINKELSRLDLELGVLSKRLATMIDGRTDAKPKLADERGLVTSIGAMITQQSIDLKLNRASLLRDSISSANIRPTSLIERASISERRIFSSLWRACLLGALLGFILSAIWARYGK